MGTELNSDQPDKKIARKTNRKALWIPIISGLVFAIVFLACIFIWSQSQEESVRLPLTFLNPLKNYYGYIFFFIIGFLAGLVPAIPVFFNSKKIYITITIIIASIFLIVVFCGISWWMMWLINP